MFNRKSLLGLGEQAQQAAESAKNKVSNGLASLKGKLGALFAKEIAEETQAKVEAVVAEPKSTEQEVLSAPPEELSTVERKAATTQGQEEHPKTTETEFKGYDAGQIDTYSTPGAWPQHEGAAPESMEVQGGRRSTPTPNFIYTPMQNEEKRLI